MPAITYDDFSGGLDRRLPINVQEANRLWAMSNAYTTLGKRIKKRPGLELQPGDFYDGTNPGVYYKGLVAYGGGLLSFTTTGSGAFPPTADVDGQFIQVPFAPSGGIGVLVDITQAVLFQGFLYLVGLWRDPADNSLFYKHQYLDGVTGIITDVNCPHSGSIAVAASRIFAIDGDVVRYCAATDPTDWTTANDAGFLPVGLQQNTTEDCTGVGTYEDALVVFFPESSQIWDVAVDPSANALRKRLAGVGTHSPLSQASFSRDLMFLSSSGFRTMRVQDASDRIDDNDTGVPIDDLVRPDIEASTEIDRVFGTWLPQLGQYWCVFHPTTTTSKVWVYSFSRSSKIGSWSEYTFPIAITQVVSVGQIVYLRDEQDLYKFVSSVYEDDGEPIDVEIQMAFQDAKQPGVSKQFYGADYVVSGSPTVAFKYDPRDLDKEGVSMTIPGDTRPGDIQGVEMVCAAIAPVFRHSADEAFELDAISLYYNSLSNFV
jgi:hypothetical protein